MAYFIPKTNNEDVDRVISIVFNLLKKEMKEMENEIKELKKEIEELKKIK